MILQFSIERTFPEDFLQACPFAPVYYAPAYHNLLSKILQVQVQYICGIHNGQLEVLMPFVVKKAGGFSVLNALPYFGSHGAFLVRESTRETVKELVQQAMAFLEAYTKEAGISAVTIVTNPYDTTTSDCLITDNYFDYKLKRVSQFSPLPAMEQLGFPLDEKLIATFKNPRPTDIRKAIKSGVEIHRSDNWEDFVFLYEVSKENMESKSLQSKDLSFFELVYREMGPAFYRLYIATIDGVKAGGLLNLCYNGHVEYFVPASLDQFKQAQPSSLLIFRAMADAIEESNHIWNWGGSGDGTGGVFEFKKKWGAGSHDYYYLNKIVDPALRRVTPAFLQESFRYFFVCPYSELESA
jgi:hypothetical protein